MLRLWVPNDAKLGFVKNQSGAIKERQVPETKLKEWQIPLFTLMGSSSDVIMNYQTRLKQPNPAWSPYFLELIGTPGREKTTFTTTLSAPEGTIQEQSNQVGKSLPLTDHQFRSVIRFE